MKSSLAMDVSNFATPMREKVRSATRHSADVTPLAVGQSTSEQPTIGAESSTARTGKKLRIESAAATLAINMMRVFIFLLERNGNYD